VTALAIMPDAVVLEDPLCDWWMESLPA